MELIRSLNALPLMPASPSERLQAILRLYRPLALIDQRELQYVSAHELRAAAAVFRAAAANFDAQASVIEGSVRAPGEVEL